MTGGICSLLPRTTMEFIDKINHHKITLHVYDENNGKAKIYECRTNIKNNRARCIDRSYIVNDADSYIKERYSIKNGIVKPIDY